MKNIKNIGIITGLFLALTIISCNKDETNEILELQQQDVVFDINNFIPPDVQTSSKGVFMSARDGEDFPECSDKVPSYVELTIDDGDILRLKLVTLNNKTETEVLKLVEGDYKLTSFIVYAEDGSPLWAAPIEGSYYELLWNLTGVDVPFTVLKFDKIKVKVDVLCYVPYDYENFGFAWFAYTPIEIHTVCFFGDICTKFYEYFHNEESPYFGQHYDGYDFAAIFSIVVKANDEFGVPTDIVVNDPDFNSNLSWQGVGEPLCIEYPDVIGIDETFTYEIWLTMAEGDPKLVYTGVFDDTAVADRGNTNGFGGDDGVFDFVVGNCSSDYNDLNLELPAFLPLPTTGEFMVDDHLVNAYFDVNFRGLDNEILFENGGNGYPAYCGDLNHLIVQGTWYAAEFYSSLEVSTIPAHFNSYDWGALNWLVNNLEAYPSLSYLEIQGAIWWVIHRDTAINPGAIENQLALDALTHSDFIPTVGDYAIVLVHDADSNPASPEGSDDTQLVIVRVDP